MPKQIKIYNTLTRKKETLVPLIDKHVRMYACGATVYDDNHIGHAMQAIFFDVIRRYLLTAGYQVTYVRNYTDVDDKIIKRAHDLGISPKKLADDLIVRSQDELEALGIRSADHEPRVSETIPEIIAMIETLIAGEQAYITDDGDVYFRVRKKADYGKLSNRSIDDLQTGNRKLVQGTKNDPLDFALWKADQTVDASWSSPWGMGRPGWHIECSAMAKAFLGDSFDIHGGGRDLVFPHHENEIAQSEAANGCAYATCWMHSGLLTIEHQKMSKSSGNSITLRAFLEEWPAEVLRLGYILNHYRSNIDFSYDIFRLCRRKLIYFYEALAAGLSTTIDTDLDSKYCAPVDECVDEFHRAMCDDFNTPEAMVALQRLAKIINQTLAKKQSPVLAATARYAADALQKIGGFLGLFANDPLLFLQDLKHSLLPEIGLSEDHIRDAIKNRTEARINKDWSKSDRIRDELLDKGIVLKDGTNQTTWTIAELDH